MITSNNLNQACKEIQKLKKEGREVVVLAQDDNFNRKIFETKNVDVVVGLEFSKNIRKDPLKQRDSGLNEVLCKLAKENNIKIGVDVSNIIKLDKLEKARVLARVRQNIFLCKKAGCKMVIFNDNKYDYNKQEIMSFFISLKGSTKQAREAFKNL